MPQWLGCSGHLKGCSKPKKTLPDKLTGSVVRLNIDS